MDESSLFRLDPDEKSNIDEQSSIILNSTLTSPKMEIEKPSKSYADSSHEINTNKRDLSSVFNDQDKEFDNDKLTNLDSITVNRDPIVDNELSTKNYIDDESNKNTIVRFNQTLQFYLKVSVGIETNDLTKYDEKKI